MNEERIPQVIVEIARRMVSIMSERISPAAAAILEWLQEALADAMGETVPGLRKTVVYRVEPKKIREQLHMSQSEFSHAFGIPISTLRNWEQGRRQLDATAVSYLRAIMKFPREIMSVQMA